MFIRYYSAIELLSEVVEIYRLLIIALHCPILLCFSYFIVFASLLPPAVASCLLLSFQ